jgi:hypothetical protein
VPARLATLGSVALACLVAPARADDAKPLDKQVVGDRVRYQAARATVYFEAGQFAPDEMERFARLAERGIADIETYLSAARDDGRRITFHVRSNLEMSSSFRRTVLLPAERVKQDRAPYLHETVHALMPSRSGCLWLSEGFASFVQSHVAEHIGGYDGYVFSWGGNGNVDRLARRHLAREGGRAVLPFVGADGSPAQIWEERREVAAPFYVLSHSFVKHLVEHAGLGTVKALLAADDVGAALARATSRSVTQWKAEWLAALGDQGR